MCAYCEATAHNCFTQQGMSTTSNPITCKRRHSAPIGSAAHAPRWESGAVAQAAGQAHLELLQNCFGLALVQASQPLDHCLIGLVHSASRCGDMVGHASSSGGQQHWWPREAPRSSIVLYMLP